MSGFSRYLAARLLQYVVVVLSGVTIAFFVTHLSPIDPVEETVSLMTSFGATDPRGVELLRAALRELYGVQGPLLEQYWSFLGRVLTGDFGPSLSAFPTPVMTLILRSLPWTLGLLVIATLLAWVIGNLLGTLAGYHRESRTLRLLGMALMAVEPIPGYIIGLTLLILFGFLWPVLPTSGGAEMNLTPALSLGFVGSVLLHGLLPAATLVLVYVGGWFVSMRSLVSNLVTEDHVTYAQLAGVKSRKILTHYVARNAMLPQVTGLALRLGHIFGGAVIIEYLFSYPGMGRLLVAGINAGDYSLVLGVTTISIVAVATTVLVIDLIYPLIDPRVKLG